MSAVGAAEPGVVVDGGEGGVGGGEVEPLGGVDVLVELIGDVPRVDVVPVDVSRFHGGGWVGLD